MEPVKKKRIVTKIGHVFCIEIDKQYKCYFQYICNDMSLLNSSVIRVFKKRYPMDYVPVIDDIVKDEVSFYAHTVLKFGIADGIWYKVGTSGELGLEEAGKQVFADTNNIRFERKNNTVICHQVNPLENWWIWRINQEHQFVGILPEQYRDTASIGAVVAYERIIQHIKYGFYIITSHIFDVLKRKPYPDVDIYLKREENGIISYYNFKGENVIREVIIEKSGVTKLSQDNPASNGRTIRKSLFYETNWHAFDFITKEEFESVWN